MAHYWQRDRSRRRAITALSRRAELVSGTSRLELPGSEAESDAIRESREALIESVDPRLRDAILAYLSGDDDALPTEAGIDLRLPAERRNSDRTARH